MPTGRTPDMLVVVDADPGSRAGVAIAQRYARGAIVLSSWDAEPVELVGDAGEAQSSIAAEPSIAEVFRVAAQRQVAWVALRRGFAEPSTLLGEILLATARHAEGDLPGFAVFLADGEPAQFRRILAVVDHQVGAISGLLAYAAVAVADTAGAVLDVLVIGRDGQALSSDDELDLLAISREQELFDRATARAVEQGITVNWLPAAEVTDPWLVIRDQLAQHDYDLVIDDLGDLRLGGRAGLERSLELALAPGQVGEIPLRLLSETHLPLLLVVDEIRLGLAPRALLKAGTVAALSLGVLSAAAVSVTAPMVQAAQTRKGTSPVDELVNDLETALGQPAGQAAQTAERAADATGTSRGRTQAGSARAAAVAATAAVVPATFSSDSETLADSVVAAEEKGSEEPTGAAAATKPKPPEGGVSPTDVAKAQRKVAKAQAALSDDKAARADAREGAAESAEELDRATADARVALADLQAAATSSAQASDHAAAVQSDASGVTGVLPGGATPQTVAAADISAQSAQQRQEWAVAGAQEALTELTDAQAQAEVDAAELADARAAVRDRQAALDQAAQTLEVYRESLAESRQSPVAKGSYHLTARFGDRGYHWSSGRHTGLDFAGKVGTTISAAASGTVVEAGWAGAYGNRVVIDVGDGYSTTYNHMSAIGVSVGDKLRTGDMVGKLGGTGNVTGPHLHFEVMKGESFVNPEDWLGAR